MSDRYPSAEFAELLLKLGQRPQEKTREEVFDVLGLDHEEYLLNRLSVANRVLYECGIEVHPNLQTDPLDGTFLLRKKNVAIFSEAVVKNKLSRLESASQEFKSTYWCNYDRLLHQPGATSKQLKSEDVKHSALKSIAGFLTTNGGTLFIGVDDGGEVLGLDPDLGLLNERKRNVDQLINNIRTDIAAKFRDGKTVNDYIIIETFEMKEGQILQLEISARRRLSFLKFPKNSYQLYRRQGNRTVTVEIHEVEEFQARRSKRLLSSA